MLDRSSEAFELAAPHMNVLMDEFIDPVAKKDLKLLFYDQDYLEKNLNAKAERVILEKLIGDEINEQCESLYRMIGAIDHAHQRHLWAPQEKKAVVQSEAELAQFAEVPVKDLLATNINAATILERQLSIAAEKAAKPLKAVPKVMSQIEKDVSDEVARLKKFMNDVGGELDGSLAKRNPQIQEAVGFTLEHMHYVLSITPTPHTWQIPLILGLDVALSQASIETEQAVVDSEEAHDLSHEDAEKLRAMMEASWNVVPHARRQEIEKTHQVKDIASAVKEFKQINDSLGALRTTIQFADTLPVYRYQPAAGERTVIASQ